MLKLTTAVRARPVASTAFALVAAATALVLWAGTRPGYDPYGWLVWGHQTLHLTLDTNGSPSWKPLPYLFTVPYALAGHLELWLWMITAAALSLAGVVFAARIAYRLTGAPPERRHAATAAAVFAGAALLGISQYPHYVLSAQSDTVIVTLCLAAIDAHLGGRHRLAYACAVLASLGRPEAWPFLGLYFLWAWRAQPHGRRLWAAGLVAIPALWFGIPWLTANSPFVAGNLALGSGRALHNSLITGTISRFVHLYSWPLEAAAALTVAAAVYRRDRTVLVLAAGVAVWVAVEVAFALHGWPGLPRYMFEAAAVMVVLTGAGVGRALAWPHPRLPGWAGPIAAVALVAALIPGAIAAVRWERHDLHHERGRARAIARLDAVIARLGGARSVESCGSPTTNIEYLSVMAWETGINVDRVGYFPSHRRHRAKHQVVFANVGYGWKVRPSNTPVALLPRCRTMRTTTPTS
jgi:hypothetical protein